MRIGFDAKRMFNNFTGLGNYSRTLIQNLLKHAPEVDPWLYTPRIGSNPEVQQLARHPGVHTIMPGRVSGSLWRSYFIHRQFDRDGIGLFHGLSNEIPFSLKNHRLPSLVTLHDLVFRVYPHTYKAFDRRMYDLKFGFACRHASKVLAISHSTRNDIIRYYNIDPSRVEVLYQACLPGFYTPAPAASPRMLQTLGIPGDFLLYVGSVIERKNLKTIVGALDRIPGHLQLPLVVVGNGGTYKKEVLAEVARLGLEKKVIWLNSLQANQQLQQLYQAARMLIYPSVYEGFGLPVAEALLCKTPVITSAVSSLPEAGGPASLYLQNPLDAAEMADAIERILTDSDLNTQMREQGYLYARSTFDPGKLSRRLLDIYKEFL